MQSLRIGKIRALNGCAGRPPHGTTVVTLEHPAPFNLSYILLTVPMHGKFCCGNNRDHKIYRAIDDDCTDD